MPAFAIRFKTVLTGLIVTTAAVTVAACGGGGDDATVAGDNAISASTSHTVFACDLANGDATDGESFKLTLGDGTATVESSDVGKHTGKLAKSAPGAPAGSERYLINGLGDDAVTSLVIPKDFRTNTRGTVQVESANAPKSHVANGFLCHPADAASPAPSSGRGSSGATSGVQGTISLACTIAANQLDGFPDTVAVTLKGDNLAIKGSDKAGDDLEGNGPFDPHYKPKANVNFDRYLVDNLIDEDATDVLIEKQVLTGKAGRIKVEGSGEDFETVTYDCKPN